MARTFACLKYLLAGVTIVVGICGITESICAGYFVYQFYEYAPLTPANVCGSSAILLGMGLITGLVSWWAWQFLDFGNKAQVIFFAMAMGLITIIETGAGVWALVRHEQIDTLPPAHLEQVFLFAVADDKQLWDHMQSKLRCCGIDGPADYRSQDAVPWSCCETSLGTGDEKGTCTTMYARGCHHVVINRVRSVLLHVFLLALCTVLLQICFVIGMTWYTRACKERLDRRKEIMYATQATLEALKDTETNDHLLNRHSLYSRQFSGN